MKSPAVKLDDQPAVLGVAAVAVSPAAVGLAEPVLLDRLWQPVGPLYITVVPVLKQRVRTSCGRRDDLVKLAPPAQLLAFPRHLAQSAAAADYVIALVTRGYGRSLLREDQLQRLAEARKKLRWRRELAELIPLAAGGAHSPLEYRHDRDVQRAHGLPEPVKQGRFRKTAGGWGYRDRCYPQYGWLVIELDGRRFHPVEQRDQDTERDNQAAVTGATLRYGWDDVTRRACETAAQEAAALRNRGWTGTLTPCSPSCRAVAGRNARLPA